MITRTALVTWDGFYVPGHEPNLNNFRHNSVPQADCINYRKHHNIFGMSR